MTVSSTTNRISYSCNGSQKEFPFNFKIFAKTDLIVILRDSGGNETTLTLTTDYTVSAGPWPTGGTVTTVKAYAEENTLVIIRELPQTQGADYVENDPFPAEIHEAGLDRCIMILQELSEKLARTALLLKSSSYSNLSMPDPVASKLLDWKDNLSGIKNVEIKSQGDLAITEYIKTLLDDEDAATVFTTLGVTAFIKTLLDDATAAAALITLGLTATAAEINTACDGITATAAEINKAADGIVYAPITGDATAGRVLRQSYIYIQDATVAAEVKASFTSIWNGDTIGSTDNIGKGETVGNFTLDAVGNGLTVEAAGLSGNCVAVLSIELYANACGTDLLINGQAIDNDIRFLISNRAGVAQDMTVLVDTGGIGIRVIYLTDA